MRGLIVARRWAGAGSRMLRVPVARSGAPRCWSLRRMLSARSSHRAESRMWMVLTQGQRLAEAMKLPEPARVQEGLLLFVLLEGEAVVGGS